MSRQRLPGIRRIEIVRSEALPEGLMLQSICGEVPWVAVERELVSTVGVPKLSWEGSKQNGTRQEKSTLEFMTLEALPEGENLAFVVTGADGRGYLIGSREGRHPVIEYSETTGEAGGTAAVRVYKVTHIAQKSVLECVL